ncbi:uncharacterized protein MCYG_02048 [Microsporum canis CBS 113480]|uniref:Uncharacterized protein n=1 Tax=Arthroderma otae (strain ATCC MYA-4605 / CBS 113480) TaxID=554155 RepID=C5FIG0_ARTOC|nr:uncharacterized protein MCYG_02048 [Microsporum canis CBS 113480]EEQ29229.1 predicted protein [Microsporum canis CBS 113480]
MPPPLGPDSSQCVIRAYVCCSNARRKQVGPLDDDVPPEASTAVRPPRPAHAYTLERLSGRDLSLHPVVFPGVSLAFSCYSTVSYQDSKRSSTTNRTSPADSQ